MTTQELRERISIEWRGYGSYRITIDFRGKMYSCTSHNSLAYDRIKGYADEVLDRVEKCGYTYKGALQSLYDECKRANGL